MYILDVYVRPFYMLLYPFVYPLVVEGEGSINYEYRDKSEQISLIKWIILLLFSTFLPSIYSTVTYLLIS